MPKSKSKSGYGKGQKIEGSKPNKDPKAKKKKGK
jgi:hypothetical protein